MISKWDNIISAHAYVTGMMSYRPHFASLTQDIFLIPVTSAEIILSHFEGVWYNYNVFCLIVYDYLCKNIDLVCLLMNYFCNISYVLKCIIL